MPLPRSALPDVRAGLFRAYEPCVGSAEPMLRTVGEVLVCGEVRGNGFYAWGMGIRSHSCYALKAENQCGEPLSGVTFSAQGRDHGFRSELWTNAEGEACMEVIPSERTGDDLNFDGLAGQVFFVEIETDHERLRGGTDIDAQENSAEAADCSRPEECVPLVAQFEDRDACGG